MKNLTTQKEFQEFVNNNKEGISIIQNIYSKAKKLKGKKINWAQLIELSVKDMG